MAIVLQASLTLTQTQRHCRPCRRWAALPRLFGPAGNGDGSATHSLASQHLPRVFCCSVQRPTSTAFVLFSSVLSTASPDPAVIDRCIPAARDKPDPAAVHCTVRSAAPRPVRLSRQMSAQRLSDRRRQKLSTHADVPNRRAPIVSLSVRGIEERGWEYSFQRLPPSA